MRDVRPIETRATESGTLHFLRIRNSDIRATRALPDTIVLKVSHSGHPLSDREVTFYGRLLPELKTKYGNADLSICDCYDAYYDTEADRSHVLLAGLPDTFKQSVEAIPPSRRHLSQLAASLAKIHACFWNDERLGSTLGVSYTESQLDKMLAQQMEGYQRFLADGMIRLDAAKQAAFVALVGKIPADFRDRLISGGSRTVIHSGLEPANLLYAHRDCRILDWKHWRVGTAVEDLANMIAFHWQPAKRRFEEPRFLQQYWHELRRCGVRDYTFEAFTRDYRIAVGMRLGEMIGSWRIGEWRDGNWRGWDAILRGLRVIEELKVLELFPA